MYVLNGVIYIGTWKLELAVFRIMVKRRYPGTLNWIEHYRIKIDEKDYHTKNLYDKCWKIWSPTSIRWPLKSPLCISLGMHLFLHCCRADKSAQRAFLALSSSDFYLLSYGVVSFRHSVLSRAVMLYNIIQYFH